MNASLEPTINKLVCAKETASNQANQLKEVSMAKANEILNNQYGAMAVQGVDSTTVLINRLIDHFFPPVEGEPEQPGNDCDYAHLP